MSNNRGWIAFAVVGGFAVIVTLWAISTNNQLVQRDEGIKAGWSQVENVYQRRMDLIPNLVNTVKGYAKHESETLENVVNARSKAIAPSQVASGSVPSDPKKLAEFQRSQDALGSALGRLLVIVEKYPDLKANQNFRDLQSQLEGTENRIAVERQRFNETVQSYNSLVRVFPASLIAGFRGFTTKPYFEAQAGAATVPKVQF